MTPANSHDLDQSARFGTMGHVVVLGSAALTAIDAFIVNVAMPAIQATFSSTPSTSQFVVSGYGLMYALLLVFGSRLGDQYGRRRLLQIGIVGFSLASLACGLAPSLSALVIARLVQGASAALLAPQVLSTLQAALSEPARTRALSFYAAIGGLSIAVGQLLGGLFVWADVAGLGWRAIFLVNVLLGLLLLIGTRYWVPETKAEEPLRADRGGTVLFGLGLLSLLIPISIGNEAGWTWWIWALVVLAFAALIAMWIYERRVERHGGSPFIAPSLLSIQAMKRGLLALGVGFIALGGFIFVFALAMQGPNQMSALTSGLSVAPMAIGQLLAASRAPKLIGTHEDRVLQLAGAVYILALACIVTPVLLWWPQLHFYDLAVGMFLIGIGNGLFVPTVYRAILSAISPAQIGLGSGIITTVQQTTHALGVAALGAAYAGFVTNGNSRTGFLAACLIFLSVGIAYVLFGNRMRHKDHQNGKSSK